MGKVTLKSAESCIYNSDGRPVYVDPDSDRCRAKQTVPRFDLLKDPEEPFSADTEFQDAKHKDAEKFTQRMGRIAVTNSTGETVYDTYVRYPYDPDIRVKMPPKIFGVTYDDLKIKNGAKWVDEVNGHLETIMKGRPIIVHGGRLDKVAIGKPLESASKIVDTQHLYGQVALSTLAAQYLGSSIQEDSHDPSEDARATMQLYLRKHPYKKVEVQNPRLVVNDQEFPPLGTAGPLKRRR